MKNVLVFPAGSEIGLEINNALKYSKHFKVYGLTSTPNHSEYVFSNCITGVPYFDSPDFIEKLNEVIKEYEIDYIYPAYDDIQLFLVQNADKINAVIVSADLYTTEICRSKSKTYRLFKDEDFVPDTYSESEVKKFPVFVKPDVGQGAQGALKVNDAAELKYALNENPGRIICEYLSGEEYTVDCFTDNDGNLLCFKMRNRKRIRTGISVSSEILPEDEKVKQIAKIINSRLHFKGAWFFQLKRNDSGEYRLMEVAPRIAGTIGITRNLGLNYPMMTLFCFEGVPVTVIDNKYSITVDRAFISRYKTDIEYSWVYVDFDDTVHLGDKVNTILMMFLYQAKNQGKNIVLLSRHSKDIHSSLKDFHISEELFSDIIVIDNDKPKSSYIVQKSAIFIDDAFSERYDVSRVCGIPVFDCSEVEALLDWRV